MQGDGTLFAFPEEPFSEAVAQQCRVDHCHERASARGKEGFAGMPSGEVGKVGFRPSLLEHLVELGKLCGCHAGMEERSEVVVRLSEVDGAMVSCKGVRLPT